MATKVFASHADLEGKKVSFVQLTDNAWAYTAEGDPNTGVFIGDDAVMVVDTQATPAMAQDLIRRIREVTDKPSSTENAWFFQVQSASSRYRTPAGSY